MQNTSCQRVPEATCSDVLQMGGAAVVFAANNGLANLIPTYVDFT